MTEVTRAELEAAARLLGYEAITYAGMPNSYLHALVDDNNEALARAAKLFIDYDNCMAGFYSVDGHWDMFAWPEEGTESACIIKAAAAVQIEREKGNG